MVEYTTRNIFCAAIQGPNVIMPLKHRMSPSNQNPDVHVVGEAESDDAHGNSDR